MEKYDIYHVERKTHQSLIRAKSREHAEDIATYKFGYQHFHIEIATEEDKLEVSSMGGYIINEKGEFDNLAILL
jgi:hypothetical protein